jgi:hypothetical protein
MKYPKCIVYSGECGYVKACIQSSGKREPVSSFSLHEIYVPAIELASESRKLDWAFYWYMRPNAVLQVMHKLETISGAIIVLVVLQGVWKIAI